MRWLESKRSYRAWKTTKRRCRKTSGNGQGEFTPTNPLRPYPFVDQLPPQVGDVNGDGILDILLPANGMITIALGKGDGMFVTPLTVGVASGLGQILMQNLHGQSAKSGLPDLVEPDTEGGITVLMGKAIRTIGDRAGCQLLDP